eukprot:m.67251 g.67251  ORF g.67251 m.67251 type:complete len:140 (+) comp12698_c0_seq1:107-526(+)
MSKGKCVFCEIVEQTGEGTRIIYEDEQVVAFHDIKPAAPLHLLVIPRVHVGDATDLNKSHTSLVQHMDTVAGNLLDQFQRDRHTARIGFHFPPFITVHHLHLHVLAPVSSMSLFSRFLFPSSAPWFKTVPDVLARIAHH